MVEPLSLIYSVVEGNISWAISSWLVLLLGLEMHEFVPETSSLIITFGFLNKEGKIVGKKLGPVVVTLSFMLLGSLTVLIESFISSVVLKLPLSTVLGMLYLLSVVGFHYETDMNYGIETILHSLAGVLLLISPLWTSLI